MRKQIDIMRKQIEQILCQQNDLASTYYQSPIENILPRIQHNWEKIKTDLSQGSGNELQSGKFNSIASSSALGINAFGVFYDPHFMIWPANQYGKFTNPIFEKKLQNGLQGTDPNLDVFFQNGNSVLAIECKFLETLVEKKLKFSEQYLKVEDYREKSKWFQVMIEIINENIKFKYLDAAQLIKHYFGLAHEYAESELNLELGYVFWKPDGDGEIPDSVIDLYNDHRKECERFAKLVVDDKVKFSFYSYFELIEYWRRNGIESELIEHFELFERKYKV